MIELAVDYSEHHTFLLSCDPELPRYAIELSCMLGYQQYSVMTNEKYGTTFPCLNTEPALEAREAREVITTDSSAPYEVVCLVE